MLCRGVAHNKQDKVFGIEPDGDSCSGGESYGTKKALRRIAISLHQPSLFQQIEVCRWMKRPTTGFHRLSTNTRSHHDFIGRYHWPKCPDR